MKDEADAKAWATEFNECGDFVFCEVVFVEESGRVD